MEIIYRLKVLDKFIKLLLLFLLMGFIKSENSVINVLNYNIQGLPDLFTSYKNPNRVEEIIKNINNYDLVLLQETICGSTKITNILIAGLPENLFRMTGNLNGEKKLKRSNDNISLSDFFKTELEFCESLHDFWERRLSAYAKGHI